MKKYTAHQTVPIEDHVTFHAAFAEVFYQDNRIVCSLRGEFLKDGKCLEPPMPYSLTNIQVSTDNLEQILQPIYRSLLRERDSLQK